MTQSIRSITFRPAIGLPLILAVCAALIFPASIAIASVHQNLSIALALGWMLFVPFGVGSLVMRLPSPRVRAVEMSVGSAGRYAPLVKWSLGFLVVLPVSMAATMLSGNSAAAAIGLLFAALAGMVVSYRPRNFSGFFTNNKRIAILLVTPLIIGLLYAGYIRSFSPFPLTPGMDVFTHLYVVKGIANNSLDSPLLYAPAFDTLIAMGSSATGADLQGIFWAGSFVVAPIFALSTFALAYRFARSFAVAIISTVIALSVTEQGFIPNMQSFYPSSFVMALFPLALCTIDRIWSLRKTDKVHKSLMTAAILGAILILHVELGILALVISALFVAGSHYVTGRRPLALYGLRAATIAITALLFLYYFGLFNSQIALRIADGQYAYDVAMKVKLLKDWYTDKIILVFLAGLVLVSLFKNPKVVLLGFIASVVMLLYFQKIDIIHRFLALERPLMALSAGMMLAWPSSVIVSFLSKKARRTRRRVISSTIKRDIIPQLVAFEQRKAVASIIYTTLVIMVLFPTLMQPFDLYENAYAQHNSTFSNFTNEELSAANWIEHNTPPKYTLFSDPFTVIEMRGLAYRKNIEAISWNNTVAGIVKSSLTAENSTAAYQTLTAQFGTGNIIVISPRTSQWIRGTDYFVQFAPSNFMPFAGFDNFLDDKYFSMVYHSENIYVFLVKPQPQ